ncbi:MAG: hypothetical protein HYR96_00480 [Deltaproteobacteria bacterium]|nr:hypothetical protein [Deltaproteobacteria bacterium]MBI3294737.1 hypothetical protein [Deltaproteobacteria bacterium]
MEDLRVFLNRGREIRRVRSLRRKLLNFFDTLDLYLACGYDLSFGWKEAARVMPMLTFTGESLASHLGQISTELAIPDFRRWFSVLEATYRSGAPLRPVVRAISESLRRDQIRDLDEHCRLLPSRANILLLLFFLPPALALVFVPLLGALAH